MATINRFNRLMLAALGVGLGVLVANQSALGQTKTITVTVDDPRPMAAAILKLEELSGIPINYEDMPVYASGDLQERIPRNPFPGVRYFGARGGELSVPIRVEAAGKLSGTQAADAALAELVAAYHSSGLPGEFGYELLNGVFFVRPVRFRDANGVTQPMPSILSGPVTLVEEKRSSDATVRLILDQISKQAGIELIPGTNSSGNHNVIFGAQDEPGYLAIARYLTTGRGTAVSPTDTNWDFGMSYRLLFDGNSKSSYALNVHQVPNSPVFAPPPPQPPPPPPRPRTPPRSRATGTAEP
jgi:hypothetical protein